MATLLVGVNVSAQVDAGTPNCWTEDDAPGRTFCRYLVPMTMIVDIPNCFRQGVNVNASWAHADGSTIRVLASLGGPEVMANGPLAVQETGVQQILEGRDVSLGAYRPHSVWVNAEEGGHGEAYEGIKGGHDDGGEIATTAGAPSDGDHRHARLDCEIRWGAMPMPDLPTINLVSSSTTTTTTTAPPDTTTTTVADTTTTTVVTTTTTAPPETTTTQP